MSIYDEVSAERARQISKGYVAASDDVKSMDHWRSDIVDYAGWARQMFWQGSPDKARRRLIQVAALAVAAVEWLDRKGGEA